MPPLQQRPLRFAVMCRAAGLPGFAADAIAPLIRENLAIPVLLIVDPEEPRPSGWKTRLKKSARLDGNLWHLHSRLFPLATLSCYQTRDAASALGDITKLVCPIERRGKYSQYFRDEDIAAIQRLDLDFILKFAFGIVRGPVLQSARWGIWSFHHDDEQIYRGGPPAFWEIQRGDPLTGAILQRLTERLDGGVVLKRCWVPTERLSYRANLQRIHEASTPLVRSVCQDILHGNAAYLEAPPSKTAAPIYRAPNDLRMLGFYARLAINWLRYKIENQRTEDWNVALVRAPVESFADPGFVPRPEWSTFRRPCRFVADPFFVPGAGGAPPRVLCEEFDYYQERGWISELALSDRAPLAPGATVLDAGVHMSYPYVFEWRGALYCVPEAAVTRSVALYEWPSMKKTQTLIEDVDAVDATIFEYGGDWWLMHSTDSGPGRWSLFVWSAPSPLGPWKPHPLNPVKIDPRSSRPAGTPFVHNGALYRPAQDCSASYGGALSLQRVVKLSITEFEEETARRIEPDRSGPYPDGLHTLSGHGGLTLIDGKRHRWPAKLMAWRLARKFFRPRGQ